MILSDTTMLSRGCKLVLENIKVGSGSPITGMTVKEGLACCEALAILAVRKKGGKLITNPDAETLLEFGDELMVIGTREQLKTLEGAA
ncbi:cation:proton antiporter regulatory subunit [Chloroflexota bacterium]